MRTHTLVPRVLPILAFAACEIAEKPPARDDFGHTGTGIVFNMGALTYPEATDVCYSFTVVSGLDQLVVGRGLASTITSATRNPAYATWGANTPYVENASYSNGSPLICSTRFGNGPGGDWSYVAPCDASDDAREHTVTVWLDRFEAGTPPAELTAGIDYQDPCPAGCSVPVTCQENADTPVTFNFTIMRRANQGFFDIGVNFDNVFCSAKLDSCYGQDPIRLLHDADGERQHSAVAAIACTAGPGDPPTHLHMTDLVISCSGTEHTLSFDAITAEGNRLIGTLQGAVYFGTEALPSAGGPAGSANKVFTNVAFILPEAPTTCNLTWTVAPNASENPPLTSDSDGTFQQVAAVSFDVNGLIAGTCANHALNSLGSQVTTNYVEGEGEPTFTAFLGMGMTAFSGAAGLPLIDGVVLHLDASTLELAVGASVEVWPNLSTQTANANQSFSNARPTVVADGLTGRRMVRFDGQDDFMAVPDFPNLSAWTIAVVYRGRPAGNGEFRGLFEFATAGQTRRGIGIGTSGEPIIVFPAGFRRAVSSSTLTDTTRVLIGRNTGTGASSKVLLDGLDQALTAQAEYGNATIVNQGVLGNFSNFRNMYSFVGEIAEVVVYDSAITDEELSVVADYLMSKWAPP